MNVKRKFFFILALMICYLPSFKAIDNGITAQTSQQKAGAITGKVKDSKGEPIIGASVRVKGTSTGTITDVNGSFTLTNVHPSATLVVSYIGMTSQEVALENKKSINVTLLESSVGMNEVVVVGYGTQKKSDITGSVTSVSKDRLDKIPVTNVMSALEGAVAGVTITQSYATPGSTPSVMVRGQNSINASTSPLIIVDGIPFESSINYINSNDIASMEILKDASAVAIYGSRGANGVILITTKKGNSGKPQIQYSTFFGVENIAHTMTPMSSTQYVQKYADYMTQTGQPQSKVLANLYEVNNYNAGITTDWLKLASQTGFMQDHNISIAGGTDNLKYFVSADYAKDKGVVKGYQYEKAGIRSNIEANVTSYMTTGLNLFLVANNYDGGRASLFEAAAMSPYGSVMNSASGKYEKYPMYPEILYTNPLLGLYQDNKDERQNANIGFFTEIKPQVIPGLKYRLNASYNYNPTVAAWYAGADYNSGNIGTADGNFTNTQTSLWVIENIFSYTKDWQKHHLDLTGLYSSQKQTYFKQYGDAKGFVNDLLSYNNLGSGNTQSVSTSANSYTMLSQMGRINYSYDSRYMLTGTVRRDGYSAFGANRNKYGVFSSVALGWNLSNEAFMKQFSNFLDQLKVRVSYGETGNNAVGVNVTESTDKAVKYPFSGTAYTGTIADVLGNANLHWETTDGFNLGIDYSFLNARIKGSIEAYSTRTHDLLLQRNLPTLTGYTFTWDNIGKVGNTGLEFSLNTVNVITKKFKWSTGINFSTNKNKILDLYGDKKSDIGNRWFIGQPVGVIYDYKMIGVWQTSEATKAAGYSCKPGYLKFQDVNGDGKYDANDKVIQGQTSPKFKGGLTNTFSYGNLSLSVFIQTSLGGMANDNDIQFADEQGRRNMPACISYWSATNPTNTYPSLAYNNTWGYGYPRSTDYTRIKDITLSYNFSPALLDKTIFKSLTVYASGRNLHTFTNWVGWDPEVFSQLRGSGSGDSSYMNNYPAVRTIVFGLNVALK